MQDAEYGRYLYDLLQEAGTDRGSEDGGTAASGNGRVKTPLPGPASS